MTQKDLSEQLTITFDGQDKILFMSVGLRNKLVKYVIEVLPEGGLITAETNPEAQEQMVLMAIYGKESAGKTFEDCDGKLSISEFRKVFDWTMAHATDFFIQGFKKIKERDKDLTDQNPELLPLPTGSNP